MSRPAGLKYPCSICKSYTRTDRDINDMAKHLLQVTGDFSLGRCVYHPLFAAPDLRNKCPYEHLVGRSEIVVICDLCNKEYDILRPGDPRLENGLKEFGEAVCDECKRLGRSSPIEGIMQGGPLIILSSPKKKQKDPE